MKKPKRTVNQSPEWREARRQQMLAMWADPTFRERHRRACKAATERMKQDPDQIKRFKEWGEEMRYHPKRIMNLRKVNESEEHKDHCRRMAEQRSKRMRTDPAFRDHAMRGLKNMDKEKRSARTKKSMATRRGYKVPAHKRNHYEKIKRAGFTAGEAARMLGLV